MRSFGHWTPRYLGNRLAEMYYRRTHPGHPWLTEHANTALESYLKDSDVGLEFGSGRSTLWLADRTKFLTSIEHDASWHEKVTQMLKASACDNVNYKLVPMDVPEDNAKDSAYARIFNTFEKDSVDYVLVDGAYRGICALNATRVIRPSGLLIIDNVNWFLPSDSPSPTSRTRKQGPLGAAWLDVHQVVSTWRCIWTSSGVTDTAFFFKPSGVPEPY